MSTNVGKLSAIDIYFINGVFSVMICKNRLPVCLVPLNIRRSGHVGFGGGGCGFFLFSGGGDFSGKG